jgi:hypothetical protein
MKTIELEFKEETVKKAVVNVPCYRERYGAFYFINENGIIASVFKSDNYFNISKGGTYNFKEAFDELSVECTKEEFTEVYNEIKQLLLQY